VKPAAASRPGLELLALSATALFAELCLIRWLPAQVRVLAYFPNLILLGAFLGLGIGCLRAGTRPLLAFWPLLLFVTTAVAAALSGIAFTQATQSDFLFLLYYDLPKDAPVVQGVTAPTVGLFLLAGLSFVPLGQAIAERLDAFSAAGRALVGYAWDLFGSLLGVAAFAVASFLDSPPLVWFLVPLVAVAYVLPRTAASLARHGLFAAAVLFVVFRAERSEMYSPYYGLRVVPAGEGAFSVLTNGSQHQYAFDTRREAPAVFPGHARMREGYHRPYELLGRPPRRALVIGAGTGNDVATLLDAGAESIDAVEIDPVILRLGDRHPSAPYASPRVHRINGDARAFLNSGQDKYDVVVFGTLDSMTRLSALSNVRLDNFVYTVESLRAVRSRLAPDGGLVLYFMVANATIDEHLIGMVASAFDEVPFVIGTEYGMFNRVLLAGPAFEAQMGQTRREKAPALLKRLEQSGELPSDDWPYLYLESRGVSGFYLRMMGILAALASAAVFVAAKPMRESLRRGSFDPEMFFFGLGFLLLETRSVTEMNLVWGGTWLTNAVVFAAILLVVLLSTCLAQLRPVGFGAGMTGALLSLVACYFVPTHLLLGHDLLGRLALSVLFVGLPVFFAGLAFAAVFRTRSHLPLAFGWNLLGAVAGGLLELTSMAVGLKALLLVALLAYLLATAAFVRRAPATGETK
jgi:spermidine synthase